MEDNPADGGDDRNKIVSEGLKYVFLAARDNFPNAPCPYNEDGDAEMYKSENMKKRKELKTNPDVKEAINDFMFEFNRDKKNDCPKDEYMKVFMDIGVILRPDIDALDLKKLVTDDWEYDC